MLKLSVCRQVPGHRQQGKKAIPSLLKYATGVVWKSATARQCSGTSLRINSTLSACYGFELHSFANREHYRRVNSDLSKSLSSAFSNPMLNSNVFTMPNNYAMDFNDDLGSDHGSSDTTDFENIFDSPNLRPSTASTSPFPTLTPESSFEKSPGPDFSPLMGDHRNYFCDTSGDILCPATATLLQDDNSLNLDSRWAPNEVAAESYGQVQPAGSCPAGIEDWKMADCDPFAQVTLTLEDVQPEILSTILNRIINTKTKIKVEVSWC